MSLRPLCPKKTEKTNMVCQNFEGILLQRKWIGRRKCWVRLHRGTLSILEKRSDSDEDAEVKITKKTGYFHLDFANLTTGKNPTSLKLRLSNGEVLKFRVPSSSGVSYREEWIKAFEDHIAYANRCIGLASSLLDVVEPGSLLAVLAKESKERMDLLQLSLVAFHMVVKETNSIKNSGVTETLHDVTGAAERAQKAMKDFYDAVLQENLVRDDEMVKERDRTQLAEDTLDVVMKKYNALLVCLDRNQSGQSVSMSSEYFTPEGSLSSFMDATYHSDDEVSLLPISSPDQRESLAFSKDDLLLGRTDVNQDVDRVLLRPDAAGRRRQKPRLASFGPMSVAGSSYNDLRSQSDRFEDCISIDTRSFIVSNGHISQMESDTSKSSHYTDARSSFASDAQSFKSANSEIRSL